MNEDAVAQAVESVINAAKATLVAGLTQNDLAREVAWLSDTALGVPPAFYAIKIHVEDAVEYNDPDRNNTYKATPYRSEYSVMILVGDCATYDPNDDVVGSVSHSNFRKFCDNIVRLVRRDTEWFPNASASSRYRIPSARNSLREVRKENVPPEPISDGVSLLGAVIRFKLAGCDD